MHIVLHPRPPSLPPSEVLEVEGQSVEVYRGSLGGERFPWSYEHLADRLEALYRAVTAPAPGESGGEPVGQAVA